MRGIRSIKGIKSKLKTAAAIVAAAGVMGGAMAQRVPMQTTKDSVVVIGGKNRLVINGQPLFISGMNIAWHNFARDIGDSQVSGGSFVNYFSQIKGAGGNAVRWWLHTDATHCPKLNDDGQVTGIGSRTIQNIRTVLDTAYNYGIVVSMCLFSFDILHNDGGNKTSTQMSRNEKFMTVPANLDTYIEKALRPILDSVGNHPAIMCWEAFNEPEGMTSDQGGWSTTKIQFSHVLRFTGKIAAEVHRRTNKMASTGVHEFIKLKNYSDAIIRSAAGGDNLAYLDFYMAHYYPQYIGTSGSPFHNPASFWNMDRPILIGEFPAQSWTSGSGYGTIQPNTGMTIVAAYEYAYNNGYLGAMSWSMTEGNTAKFGNFNTTKPALENLYAKYKSDIEVKTGGEITPPETGDHVMKVAFTNLATGDANEVLLKKETSFSGRTNLTFEIYIAPSSGSSLRLYPAIQTGENDNWGWYTPASPVNIGAQTKGQWVTISLPINTFLKDGSGAAFGSSAGSYAVFLKFVSEGSAFTGTVYIDNIKADNTVIADFDEPYSEWGADGEADVSRVTRASVSGTSSVRRNAGPSGKVGITPTVSVRGNVLSVAGADNAPMAVRLVNVSGKTVARFSATGRGQFSLAQVPAGRYVVETRVGGRRVGSSAVVVR